MFNDWYVFVFIIADSFTQAISRLREEQKKEKLIANCIDENRRWSEFLENKHFCDVMINVQGTVFELHRVKLSEFKYFYDLFLDKNCNSTSRKYSFNNVDSITFERIIHYIYKGEIRNISDTQMLGLLKASKFFQMDELYKNCCSSICENVSDLTYLSSETFALFQFACDNERFNSLYNTLVKRIREHLWPHLTEHTRFRDIPFETLKEILAMPRMAITGSYEILDQCTEWIFHDIDERYRLIVEVAKAIKRCYTMDLEQIKIELPPDSTDYSRKYIHDQLERILSSASLLPSKVDVTLEENQKPRFVILTNNGNMTVANINFDKVVAFGPNFFGNTSF